MDKQDLGRFPTGHATHEPSRSVLALRVGIVSAIALLAASCTELERTVGERIFEGCVAKARDNGTQDMAGAIKACADAAEAIEAQSGETERLDPQGESAARRVCPEPAIIERDSNGK